MLSRRPALWIRLLPLLALVLPGCDGGQATVSPTPAPVASFSLTCALGSTNCSTVMQGQTLTFTARPGDGGLRSAVVTYGDGSPDVNLGALSAPATFSHEYTRLGSFTARLDATTASGESRSSSVAIEVGTLVTGSIVTRNLGNLNVEAVATIVGAPVARYEWSFEPFLPPVITTEPRAVFTYPSPGFKAVELRAVLTDGRAVVASAEVVVGREHEG